MSCKGDSGFSNAEQNPGSKRHSSSNSSSGSKGGKCENPDSKPSGPQDEKIPVKDFMNLYIFVKLLGFGAFGTVNLMRDLASGIFYAVKVVKKTDPHTDAEIRYEIELGMKLDSQYVCKVHRYHEDDEHFYIIMDYLKGMDLCDFIRKDPKFFTSNPTIFWFVVESILRGLAYLHSQAIAHMDIKPENILLLLDNEGNIIGVKLIDLGLSMVVNDATKKCIRGTNIYMAPEFFHPFSNIDCKVDIWSIGITVFAMIKASLPTEIESRKKNPKRRQDEIYQKIERLLMKKSFNPFGEETSKDPNIKKMESFTLSCLITNPTNRPTAVELLGDISFTSTISQISL
jgi:serine/threonine protein kinase